MSTEFDPYWEWLRIAPGSRPPNHYELLGLTGFETGEQRIRQALNERYAHIRKYTLTPPHDQVALRMLNELSAAAACLLDPNQRADYDRRLRGEAEGPAAPSPAGRVPTPPVVAPTPATLAEPSPATSLPPAKETPRPAAAPTAARPKPRARSPRPAPAGAPAAVAAVVAAIRCVDDRLRAVAGKGNRALHNLLRAVAVGAPLVLVVGLVLLVRGGSDDGAADPGASPAAGASSSAAPAAAADAPLSPEDAWKIWNALYDDQRRLNPWPAELGPDFLAAVAALGPNQDIPVLHREVYHRFMTQRLKTLGAIVDARRPRGQGDNSVGSVGSGPGSMGMMGARPVEMAGVVDWDDQAQFVAQHAWPTTPSSDLIRTAQEDLWVCEGMLRSVHDTNEGQPSRSRAAVKRIAALEIGSPAVAALRQESESAKTEVEGAAAPGSLGMTPMGAAPGMLGTPGAQSDSAQSGQRYVDAVGNPHSPTDPSPFVALRILPVHLRVVMDQTRIPRLLGHCAAAGFPLHVKRLRIERAPAREASGLGLMGAAAAPEPVGPNEVSVDLLGEVLAIVPPDRGLLDRAVPGLRYAADLVRGRSEGTHHWLALLRAVDAALPRDPEGKRPAEIADRNELHVTGLVGHRVDRVEDWLDRMVRQGWRERPTGADAAGPASVPTGPGWIVQLTGHHFHNRDGSDRVGAQFVRDTLLRALPTARVPVHFGDLAREVTLSAAEFGIGPAVLVNQQRADVVFFPDASRPGQPGGLTPPGAGRIPPLSAMAGSATRPIGAAPPGAGEGISARRFDFTVQWAWQPALAASRLAASAQGLEEQLKARRSSSPPALLTSWDPPLFAPLRKRSQPAVYPVRDLRVAAGQGAFAMADEDQAAGLNLAGKTRGQRWVVVTGLIDHARHVQAFQSAFQGAPQPNPAKDFPSYAYCRIERAEVDPAAPEGDSASLAWQRINLRDAVSVAERWREHVADPVDGRFWPSNPHVMFPLGPLKNRSWGPEVAHPPEIPIGRPSEGMPSGEGVGRLGTVQAGKRVGPAPDEPDPPSSYPTAVPGMGVPAIGMPGMPSRPIPAPYGAMPGMMPADYDEGGSLVPGVGRPAAEHLLFRFFDFAVEPGRAYRYRVRLLLANSNHGVPADDLESESLGQPQHLETEWSAPSPAVLPPGDCRILAVGASAGPQEASPGLLLVRWNAATGLDAYERFAVSRGQWLNYRKCEFTRSATPLGYEMMSPVATAEEKTEVVDFVSDTLVLDLIGGGKLPGRWKDSPPEPAAVLLLDPAGNLVVADELDHLAESNRYPPTEIPESAAAKTGTPAKSLPGMMPGMMPGMSSPYGLEALDDGGGKKKRSRSKAPAPYQVNPGGYPGPGDAKRRR